MARRNTWRANFNEWELSQIDAAAPSSLLGRLAKLLDAHEAMVQAPPNMKQFNEQHKEQSDG